MPTTRHFDDNCVRCGVLDLLWDGLCRRCEDAPELVSDAAMCCAGAVFASCEVCGRDVEYGALCPRCHDEFNKEMERDGHR